MNRIVFSQAESWDHRTHSAYSREHCCYCARPLKGKFAWLMLSRDDGGEWYLVDPSEPVQPDETMDGRFALPIGMTCLRRHPEFRFALTTAPEGKDCDGEV